MTSDITYCNATKCEFADFCERHYSHHLPTNPEDKNMWMQDFSVSIGLTAAGGEKRPQCPSFLEKPMCLYFLDRPDPAEGLKALRDLGDYGSYLKALDVNVREYVRIVRGIEEDEEGDESCHGANGRRER